MTEKNRGSADVATVVRTATLLLLSLRACDCLALVCYPGTGDSSARSYLCVLAAFLPCKAT